MYTQKRINNDNTVCSLSTNYSYYHMYARTVRSAQYYVHSGG